MKNIFTAIIWVALVSCTTPQPQHYYVLTASQPAIAGKPAYLQSPFVTAGDRVYMVGHQDGSFPDLGWHVPGEMGGIWDHPIKLMDGFGAVLTEKKSGNMFCLDKAENFVNYPVGNKHHFVWQAEALDVQRFQFVPDGYEGMIVEYTVTNNSAVTKQVDFSFTGHVDLRPTWLGERTNLIDAADELSFDQTLSAVVAKDKNNPWYVVYGGSLNTNMFSSTAVCQTVRKGLGVNGTLTYELVLPAGAREVIQFFVAGSYQSEAAVRDTYSVLKSMGSLELDEKIKRYTRVKETSNLIIPDTAVAQMYEWLKYNTEWLVRTVPEQGRAVSAGLPDYPWWFGADMTYALQGILATGNHTLAKNSIQLLHKISQQTNGNGRVLHEVSTNGAVFNPGNVNETAQYITLLNVYANWTGDQALIAEVFPSVKQGLAWLTETMDADGNGYPNGNGMMEIHGLDTEMIDVVAYTQQAFASAAQLATWVGEKQLAIEYQERAAALKTRINTEWWNEQEQSFGDFRSTVAEARPIVAAALVRADTLGKPWAVRDLRATEQKLKSYSAGKQLPFVVYHNWVVNTPLETRVADTTKALAALQTATQYENPFGVYVTGIDRSDEPDSVVLKSRKKTFSYTGAVMTLPTGVQAVAAANYGQANKALGYIKKLRQSFSYALPGSMYEVSPDFGMVVQAWNIYGVAVPIIQSFFGIKPHAMEKQVVISPQLPDGWDHVAIKNVIVGANTISVTINRGPDYDEYQVQQTAPDWTLNVAIPNAKKILVDQQERPLTAELALTGTGHVVRIYK